MLVESVTVMLAPRVRDALGTMVSVLPSLLKVSVLVTLVGATSLVTVTLAWVIVAAEDRLGEGGLHRRALQDLAGAGVGVREVTVGATRSSVTTRGALSNWLAPRMARATSECAPSATAATFQLYE